MKVEDLSGNDVLDSIKIATEKMLATQYKQEPQKFIIPPVIAHKALQDGVIEFDMENECHKLTKKGIVGLTAVWFMGIRKDCQIYISSQL